MATCIYLYLQWQWWTFFCKEAIRSIRLLSGCQAIRCFRSFRAKFLLSTYVLEHKSGLTSYEFASFESSHLCSQYVWLRLLTFFAQRARIQILWTPVQSSEKLEHQLDHWDWLGPADCGAVSGPAVWMMSWRWKFLILIERLKGSGGRG